MALTLVIAISGIAAQSGRDSTGSDGLARSFGWRTVALLVVRRAVALIHVTALERASASTAL